MEATVSILGVCCSCQSQHPVVTNDRPEWFTDNPVTSDGLPDLRYDEAVNYLMANHRIGGDTGIWCEGEGTVPQTIIRD